MFLSSLQIFFSITFIKIIFQDNMCVPNRLDPDQTRHSDHGPLTKLFATTKLVPSRQRVVLHVFTGIYFKLISEYYCFKMMLIGV